MSLLLSKGRQDTEDDLRNPCDGFDRNDEAPIPTAAPHSGQTPLVLPSDCSCRTGISGRIQSSLIRRSCHLRIHVESGSVARRTITIASGKSISRNSASPQRPPLRKENHLASEA